MPDNQPSKPSDTGDIPADETTGNPNPAAPAGTRSSLGAQSVRDGRPDTCDDVVEALDEAGPGPK
jgi:hypothetical protein